MTLDECCCIEATRHGAQPWCVPFLRAGSKPHGACDGADALALHPVVRPLLGVVRALPVAGEVRRGEAEHHRVQEHPVEAEVQDVQEQQEGPQHGPGVDEAPEDFPVGVVQTALVGVRLEEPLRRAVLADAVPPSEADQQAAGHILHRPEVERRKDGGEDEGGHIGAGYVPPVDVCEEDEGLERCVEHARDRVGGRLQDGEHTRAGAFRLRRRGDRRRNPQPPRRGRRRRSHHGDRLQLPDRAPRRRHPRGAAGPGLGSDLVSAARAQTRLA
mmetsp:Transcript_87355/g.247666  ORF Transcript_87355/g.247666 Transcript_87355/m.247666 type:complete len:272 (+) Transcript_87355:215-1030(+)